MISGKTVTGYQLQVAGMRRTGRDEINHLTLTIPFHDSRLTIYLSRFTFHDSRLTIHVSPFQKSSVQNLLQYLVLIGAANGYGVLAYHYGAAFNTVNFSKLYYVAFMHF